MPPNEELRFLPEGPRVLRNYPAAGLRAGWVAIQHGSDSIDGSMNVLEIASGKNTRFPLIGRPGFFAETERPGVVMIGLERALRLFNLLTGEFEDEGGVEVTRDEAVIINDGLAVEGGVLFGTKHVHLNLPVAALYFFDAGSGRVHTVVDRQTCSNGKFLRRDAGGATLIDIDSIPKTITRYRLDAGLETVIERSLVVAPESLRGFPDGLRPAPDGESVIVAFYNPEAVTEGRLEQIRISDGEVLCEWIVPGSPRVTCPEFIEMDRKVKLLITTAVEGMPETIRAMCPGAGTIYIADTPFEAMPDPPPLVPCPLAP
jgi:sugar lactone lactonase YvrE